MGTLSVSELDGLRIIRGPLYKSTLLLTAPLLCALLAPVGSVSAYTVFLFFLDMFLYLCFAYAVNDWADRAADLAAGKHRTLAMLPGRILLPTVTALLLATVAVGYRLCSGWLYMSFLAAGLLLLLAYSARPWRIKGRGIWGVIIAPVPGKVIPVCLACIVFRRFGWYFLVIMLAESAKNAIDILFHQILDFENDMECGIRTYPVTSGTATAARSLRRLVGTATAGALAMGATLAWLVEEYRWIFGAALLLAAPVALTYRKFWNTRSAGSPAPDLPFAYLWFGGIIFLQSPMWLSGIAAWQSRSFLPLTLAVTVITVSQTIFYLRYRYR
jgi:4-hydroxybenzoate polyprenyltransferase